MYRLYKLIYRLIYLSDYRRLQVTCILAADDGAEPPLLVSKGFAVVAVTFSRSGDTARVTGSTFVRLEGAQVTGTRAYTGVAVCGVVQHVAVPEESAGVRRLSRCIG